LNLRDNLRNSRGSQTLEVVFFQRTPCK